jgi:hypothetical protein
VTAPVLTGPYTDAAEDTREDVVFLIDPVGPVMVTTGDEADVLGDVRVGGTAPLAIDDLVEVIRVRSVGSLHGELLDSFQPHARNFAPA